MSCGRVGTCVDRLQHLNEYLRIPIERLHDAVHDLRHVVEIDVQIHLGQHADDSQLHFLDTDIEPTQKASEGTAARGDA